MTSAGGRGNRFCGSQFISPWTLSRTSHSTNSSLSIAWSPYIWLRPPCMRLRWRMAYWYQMLLTDIYIYIYISVRKFVVLEDQFTNPWPCPQTSSPCPRALSPYPCHGTLSPYHCPRGSSPYPCPRVLSPWQLHLFRSYVFNMLESYRFHYTAEIPVLTCCVWNNVVYHWNSLTVSAGLKYTSHWATESEAPCKFYCNNVIISIYTAPCGLQELWFFVRIGSIRFQASCRKRRLNQG